MDQHLTPIVWESFVAGARDRELYTAEAKFATAKEESEFYMASLQQLTLFKSRSERALLDTQSRAESAAREAQEARARYEKVRSALTTVPCIPVTGPVHFLHVWTPECALQLLPPEHSEHDLS